MTFVHLDAHSHFSFMRGVSSPAELCAAAAAAGQTSLAVTDINGLYGCVWFWQDAVEAGLRPILGADLRAENEQAVLLVRSPEGYARLCEIITSRHLDPDFSLSRSLVADRRGLAVLSPDAALLDRLLAAGDTDLHVALPPGHDSRALLRFAHDRRLTPVACGGAHFARRDQHQLLRLVRAIDLNTTLPRVPAAELVSPDCWLAPEQEIRRRFPHCPEAVDNAARLAEKCIMTDPPWTSLLFPDYEGLDRDAAFRMLRSRALAGSRTRYGRITPPVRERLDRELKVIGEKGFAVYFLVVEDIVRHFPITCGRGSAAASIVSYCLFITHVDPIRHDLFFERFLNPGRVDPPDIDVDFPWDTRDEVFAYVFKKYGDRNAAMVANHVAFQARAAVREIAKVHGLPEGEIKRVTGRMRGLWHSHNAAELVKSHPLFKDLKLEPPWPEVLARSLELESIPRYLSVHSGGVVIAPGQLDRRVPLQRAPKGVNIIHWEKDQTEDAGLVKIDLLGNRSLAVIRDALGEVKAHGGPEIPYRKFNPIDDPETQALVGRGETIGVFYVESPPMRLLQQKTGAGDFERLVVHSSIIRPAANDYIKEYVRRHRGGEFAPLHPVLGEIMAETYGIMVYQEDVCKVAMALAGFDAVEGDGLRKVLGKKHKAKKLADYREKFIRGALQNHDLNPALDPETVEKIWDMIMSFSGYSFCKPHSASYALVSFKSAWLRCHFPAEFIAAVISNQGGYYHAFEYLSEARRMGLNILPPDVNESMVQYTGRGRDLRVGLMQIKGLTKAGMEAVVAGRVAGPYASFADFLQRVRPLPADGRLLVRAGCFDRLEGMEARPSLLWRLLEHAAADGPRPRAGGKQRPVALGLPFETETPLPKPPGYNEHDLLLHEVETLGFLASRHPLSLFMPELKPLSWVPAADFKKWVGHRVTTIGWYVTGKLVETKKGEPMEFLCFEDTTGIYEATFFPKAYNKFCHLFDREQPYVLQGRIEEEFGALTMTVDNVRLLTKNRKPVED